MGRGLASGVIAQQQATWPRRPVTRYNPSTPAVRQSGAWQCSAASTAWLLRSIGRDYSQDSVVDLLGPNEISPDVGLHRGDGSGLADLLERLGLTARRGWLSFDEVWGLAGRVPLIAGFVNLYHWTGIRGRLDFAEYLVLSNPAPEWRGVYDQMSRNQFNTWGPAACVWLDL